jgi:predicted nucleic acid-binding protein
MDFVMKVLFDTSVLVASLVRAHPRHPQAADWHRRGIKGEVDFFVSSHSLLELFAVLTRLPLQPSIQPSMAWTLIRSGVADRATIVPLTPKEYVGLVEEAAGLGLTGGVVYDALIARAAKKVQADVLLTLNPEHFRRVWPLEADRIRVP